MVNRVKEIRKVKKMTITELSAKSGISRQTIYKLESQKTNPSLDTISKISSGLDEKPEKIFNFSGIQELQKEA
ncbi:XRE family transcriptional regulator [Staphylococcus arlettae]|uniref:helix-turn-helix transcriptional regulator n=1 Tax=Staphylococcus arlettae TaxID=29378 RepID=UPI001072E860|nr:helix-turn-helix transcriptional regulator [Staphylococcus arlettae]MBF0736829.1 helix-turn-helix transcriptional regulator [Staphylococcus arlettae]TFU48400.1 XRE family transcriptional regulator [Staphylococcus arlettae]